MAEVRFSIRAKDDLRNISVHTIQTWGESQAYRYLNGLEDCCNLLGSNPGLGRACDWIRPGLHQGMLPGKHEFEDS